MLKNRSTKLMCLLIAFLWTTIVIGSSYAYFIDTVNATGNIVTSGNLKAAMSWKNPGEEDWKDASQGAIFNYQHWEPGYTDVKYIKVQNTGNLAFQYELNVFPAELLTGRANLLDVLEVYYGENVTGVTRDNYADRLERVGTLTDLLTNAHGAAFGILLPENPSKNGELPAGVTASTGSVEACMVLHMQETAGNEYQNLTVGDGFKVQLAAAQYMFEKDSFGNLYDQDADEALPELNIPTSMIIDVTPVNGLVPYEVRFNDPVNGVSATVPAGAKMADGATSLKLVVEPKKNSEAKVNLTADEELFAYNVKVEGLAADNTVPVVINMGEVLPNGLNLGNYDLYHVENGVTVKMTLVDSATDLDAHNEFTYDPVNGAVSVAMATFSEVALVADTVKPWEGTIATAFGGGTGTAADPYIIANADQLAGFGAMVGGMNGQTQDSFAGKYIKLTADVNLGNNEEQNNSSLIFYPIGYNSDDGKYEKTGVAVTTGFYAFEGTFDGNGHTIANFYQNTWEMKGDNNYYDATLQYYRDGMGLFGKVYGGTVKNLTVDNFSSDGEYTTTGVIAAYADGAAFENIAITNCNPRVYNIGNGGIVGCVGWYAKEAGLKTTFTNITVDNSNKISALWGSYDVACGGIVGQYYPTSGQKSAGTPKNGGIDLVNCHVSAQMDVYNDVCGNYQYYAYRYAGMMIGSIRENETIDGYVYPKMDGIAAKGCTVHFGDWNDYYYCELVANSLASYTHDHQMSRLEQVKNINGTTITYLDGTTGTVPASGAANYVIVNGAHATENADCYHFVDGKRWTHDMAGTETVNDESVPKEDKQHIYLEFNNLFTGYGWGVTSKGLKDLEGIKILDIASGDHEKSVEKFTAKTAENAKYTTGTKITIGKLFAEKENAGVEIKTDKVQVFVSPVGDTSTAGGTYVANTTDWTQGTLTFTGKGEATITITDYYFCTETKITVEITAPDFMYRVGNQNPVTKEQIAKLLTGKESYSSMSIEKHVGNVEWNGSNQFSGTGIVKVVIDGESYYLEVVDAKNAATATNATDNNVVLLNDISGGFTVSDGYAFYGNGFKATCAGNGSYRSAALSYGFVTVEKGGVLDNVQIICDTFPESYLYTSEMKAGSDSRYPYGYSAVVISGNSTISNSYIYGARNNIHIGDGNVTVKNTVTECGSLSNIHINSNDSYTVTLDDVTTIQYQTTSKYDTSKKVLGFGILVGTNESATNAKLHLTGDLKQYNWVTSTDTSVSNTYAKTAITEALKVSAYQHTINNTTTVNMGIVHLNDRGTDITDERTNKTGIPYKLNSISMSGQTGQVYSISGSSITADSRYDAKTDGILPYNPTQNREIYPDVIYSPPDSAITATNGYDSNKARWQSKLTVDLDNITGGSYTFMFSKLTVQKYDGVELAFTVKGSDGNTVDKSTAITLDQLYNADYTLIVTDNHIYDANGNLNGKTITVEIPFVISATKTSIDPPKFTNAGTATAIRLVSSQGGDWRPAYTVLTGVSVTYWSASEGKVKTVDLSTLNNSGTISSNVWTYTCNDYTLTITGGAVHSDGTTITPVVANSTLYFASTNKAFGTGTTSRNIILTYVFTDKNASTTWNRTETVTYSDLSEYDYNSFKNDGTLTEPSSGGGCVTPDTLITLADGMQVRVDSLTGSEELLVWNMETGTLDAAPILFVDSDPEEEFEIVHLYFSDGTDVKVIYEHGFWDYDLNKYVYLDRGVEKYIGHTFAKHSGDALSKVKLTDVVIEKEVTTAWSPVTADHLCYFVNGMLSMPGGVGGLFNIFEVDPTTMTYDMEALARDIDTYGLFTYEELNAIAELPEEMFNAAGGAYLKVSIGKGNLTMDELIYMIQRYTKYFE